jgi:hypothetical protein
MGVFEMQLKLRRTQKTSGMMSKSVVFCLDARLHLTAEEAENVRKYRLGDMVIYNSENKKKHMAAVSDALSTRSLGSVVKGYAHLAMSALSLNITFNKLVEGTHVECKDMDELLGAEEAIEQAAEAAKTYLALAETFDGREIVRDLAEVH